MKILVIGGAGFIGSHLVKHHLEKGDEVTIFDNLSRRGTELNIKWLKGLFKRVLLVKGDIRYDKDLLLKTVSKVDLVYHMAAQVAVTTSVTDPQTDFEINAMGTFNVLESVRKSKNHPILFYASTNKVYGKMADVKVVEARTRYCFPSRLKSGVSENQNLDFYSPYGCSKGAADQYVLDYARIYDLRTVVFRQSCIYGPQQYGVEDQGWIAWFIIATILGKSMTIYGDGKQVRDVLYIDDLVRAFEYAGKKIDKIKGQAFNIGGGPRHTLSVWKEFGPMIEKLLGRSLNIRYDDFRPGDQLVYVSNIEKAKKLLGWEPRVSVEEGVKRLYLWVDGHREMIEKIFSK